MAKHVILQKKVPTHLIGIVFWKWWVLPPRYLWACLKWATMRDRTDKHTNFNFFEMRTKASFPKIRKKNVRLPTNAPNIHFRGNLINITGKAQSWGQQCISLQWFKTQKAFALPNNCGENAFLFLKNHSIHARPIKEIPDLPFGPTVKGVTFCQEALGPTPWADRSKKLTVRMCWKVKLNKGLIPGTEMAFYRATHHISWRKTVLPTLHFVIKKP